jgi:hypothetical protein
LYNAWNNTECDEMKGEHAMQTQLHHPSNPDAETDRAETWTSGEWIGEGQGAGPRTDTGTFHARQWVGAPRPPAAKRMPTTHR